MRLDVTVSVALPSRRSRARAATSLTMVASGFLWALAPPVGIGFALVGVPAAVLIVTSLPFVVEQALGRVGQRRAGAFAAAAVILGFIATALTRLLDYTYYPDWPAALAVGAVGTQVILSAGLLGLALVVQVAPGGWLLRAALIVAAIGGAAVGPVTEAELGPLYFADFALGFAIMLLGAAAWPPRDRTTTSDVGAVK